ncbi:MFS transporter [Pseudomonas sp. NA-150]|uniref:MFS transporter n=1 Tax=Pseudomonas sp. NA-150 TaxID=3367525 RepID=UPI0037C4F461
MTVKETIETSLPVAGSASGWPSPTLAWYTVFVLFLAYTFSYVDRVILTILVEPIQRDLGINDSQLALLHGLAFVIFYVVLGVSLGYAADRANRKRIIVISIITWSLMTACCGLAKSFGQLFMARAGVGVGEAGLSPAGYSLLGDYFPPHKRGLALGVYTAAIVFGGGVALIIGGLVVQAVSAHPTINLPIIGATRSWQAVFFIVGLPGLLVGLLAMTLKEPMRRTGESIVSSNRSRVSFLTQFKRHKSSYLLHIVGFSMLSVPFNVTLLWGRPFLSRTMGLSPSQGAYTLGVIMMIFCTAGILSGSALSDRLLKQGHIDATIRVGVIAAVGLVVPLALFPFTTTITPACFLLAMILYFGSFAFGVAPAALQFITQNENRAVMTSLYLLGVSFIGLTAGPTLTGVFTDYVFKDKALVGYSAAIVSVSAAVFAALAFLYLLPRFRKAADQESRLWG